jgi:hypothetical protein
MRLPREIAWNEQEVLIAMGVCPHCGAWIWDGTLGMRLSVFHKDMISQWNCGCLRDLEERWWEAQRVARGDGLCLILK